MTFDAAVPERVARQQALAGRVPITHANRIYTRYTEFLLTCATLGAASYAYLVGSSLATIGSTWVGILGYMLGLIIGTAIVSFAVGLVSYRYGVDPVDASKIALGSRGAVLVLLGVVASCAGWGNVLLAMTARGVLDVWPHGTAATSGPGVEWSVVAAGLLLIALIWLLLSRGAKMMERAASIGAVIQIGVAILFGAITLYRFGLEGSLFRNVPVDKAYTADHLLQVAYAIEFGIANGLGLFPFIGGLARLVRHKRHVIGPAVIGYPVAGSTLVACVGALAAMATGKDELSAMLTGVCGPTLGTLLLAVILVTNIGTLVTQFYVVGLAVQQMSAFARLKWPAVAAAVLVPSLFVVFNTTWILNHVMTFMAYNAVMFVGAAAVMFVDYFILRRQHVVPSHLFARRGNGIYWFRGGVNWIAMAVIVGSGALYLAIFDPVSLRASGPFRYLGASIPVLATGAIAYFLLMRLFVTGKPRSGYGAGREEEVPLEVGL
jgi:nucleobase:cation symporter-1, NCS1 family